MIAFAQLLNKNEWEIINPDIIFPLASFSYIKMIEQMKTVTTRGDVYSLISEWKARYEFERRRCKGRVNRFINCMTSMVVRTEMNEL